MIIQHNMPAMNAHRQLLGNNNANTKALEKLSSGYRINRAGDDAAGLAISEKMRAQIRGLDMAGRNAQDGISLIQTAEGALNETHSILQRMRELAVQSANGIYDNEVDRANLDKEVQRLKQEVDRISTSTNFNNINLLNGDLESTASVTEYAGVDAGTTENVGSLTTGQDFITETYTIDLATIGIDFDKQVEHGEAFTISLESGGGQSITLTSQVVTNDLGTADKNAIRQYDNMADIAALFEGTGFMVGADGAQNTTGSTAIGDAVYSVSVVGTKLTITHEGTATAAVADTFKAFTAPGAATGTALTAPSITNAYQGTLNSTNGGVNDNNAKILEKQRLDLGGAIKFAYAADGAATGGVTDTAGALETDTKFLDTTTTDLTGKLKMATEGTNSTRTTTTITKAAFEALNLRDGDSLTFHIADADATQVQGESYKTVTFDYVSSGANPLLTNDAGNGTFTTIEDLIKGINASYVDNEPPLAKDVVAAGLGDATLDNASAKAIGNNETGITITVAGNQAYGDDGVLEISHTSVKKASESIVTFEDGVREGSTVRVNGKTFEFVSAEKNAIKGNEAIVVNALAGGAELTGAQAAKAFNDYLNTQNLVEYSNKIGQTSGVDDNVVSIFSLDKTAEAGQAAVDIASGGLTFQIGANGLSDQRVSLNVSDMSSIGLGIADISIGTQDEANLAIDVIDDAINFVSGQRAELGALQNRLEHTISNLAVNEENLQAAESRIRDVDMAEEMMNFTKTNILSQAAQSMLSQANMQTQSVLNLLG